MGDTGAVFCGDFYGVKFGDDLPKRLCGGASPRACRLDHFSGGRRGIGTSEAAAHQLFQGKPLVCCRLLESGLLFGLQFDF